MTIDQERMVVVLEARLDKLEKGFQKARQAANTNLNAIVADANKMETALAKVGGGGFDRAARSANALKMQTGNLAAQFNDIGVQLAGGQSPFLIALQQGTQINQVLGPMGARGAVAALGGAFTSLMNPVGLATIAIISLGGAAVQYLMSLLGDGEKANQTLEEHAKLIKGAADRWGEAVPSLKAYNDELQKRNDLEKLIEGGKSKIAAEYDAIREKLVGVNAELTALTQLMLERGQTEHVKAIETAFDNLENRLSENNATGRDAQQVMDALNVAMNDGVKIAPDLADRIRSLVPALNEVARSAGNTREQMAAVLGANNPSHKQADDWAYPATVQLPGTVGVTPERRVDPYFDDARRGGRDAAAEAAKRERQAVVDLIAQLEFEQSLIGRTAIEKERELALRKAGSAATEEQRARIAALTEQIYLQEQAQKATEEATKRQKQAMEQLGQIGTDALNGIVGAFEDGKITGEEMIQVVGRLIQQLMSMPNGGFGGILSSIFGGGFGSSWGGATGPWGKLPGFAGGTNYAPGGMAWVGERGPELINVPRGSQIVPSAQSLAMARGGGITTPISIQIDARGADREGLSRVEQQVARLKAELPSMVVSTVRTANKSNVRF